jgi:apolipoprotein N-acyltransferase
MKISKNNLIFILPVISGLLLTLAYPPYDWEFLIWISLIPLLWFINLKSITPKKAFIGGIITGFIFLGKLFSWLLATAPFEWLGVATEKNQIFILLFLIVLWLIQTIFLSLFFGIFSWLIKNLFIPKLKFFLLLLTIPSFWVILEYLRAWGFGILWLGKETFFGPHWTFGNLAYALHNQTNLIQLTDITGIYGISFLIVLINVLLFFLFLKIQTKPIEKKKIFFLLLILILIGSAWSFYGFYRSNNFYKFDKSYKIALVQTNFLSGPELNTYQKEEVFKAVLNLFGSPQSIQAKPDFIIAPEGFGLVSLVGNKNTVQYLLKDFWHSGQIFLENQKIEENGKIKSRLFYYDLEKQEPLAFYDKMLLVPNGEFLPYVTNSLLNIYSFEAKFKERFYQRGEKLSPAHLPKGIIGGTICSSIVSPNIQRQITKKGAEFLVVISSDAPFHGNKSLLTQNLAMSKLRAVENRRYFAQATNMGYSFLINPQGKVIAKTPQLGNGLLFSDIQLINKKTIYTRFGDWLIIGVILLLIPLTFKKCYN